MATVTVSSKFQVTLPRGVMLSLGIRPGVKLQVLQYDNRIELIPVKPIRKMRGFLPGLDTRIDRDRDRL